MKGYEPSTYGDRVAPRYDEWVAEAGLNYAIGDQAIDLLAELAGGSPALELGIGTGRVALPLAERGVTVVGVDASEAMVEQLRAKPGGDAIRVEIGDFGADLPDGPFGLVFVVFNTFFGLQSQEDQLRCFRNVADRLTPAGAFLLEVFVPDLTRFDREQRVWVQRVEADQVEFNVDLHDPVEQRVASQKIALGPDGWSLLPVAVRYAYPSELDLMARLAGLRLRNRWGDWDRRPFTAGSTKHISVYGPAS